MNFFSSRLSSTPSATLIAFYAGTGRDHRGRKLNDILQWGANNLESSHDYIQTLFPLPEESGVNWSAPIINREVFEAFRSRPELREKLRESFKKMLWFYGFELKIVYGRAKPFRIVKGENYEANSENWDTRFDHNHLRITRIIRCLRVLGLEDEALAFREALEKATTSVSSRSREFWRRAAERDLNLRPDLETHDEEDNTIGPKFLREYEVKRKEGLKEAEAEVKAKSAVTNGEYLEDNRHESTAAGTEPIIEENPGKELGDDASELKVAETLPEAGHDTSSEKIGEGELESVAADPKPSIKESVTTTAECPN